MTKRLVPWLAWLCWAAGLAPAAGLAADPLKSPECGRSLAALQAARGQEPGAADAERLRQQATRTCLGGAGEAGRPAPAAQPPIEVPPPTIEVPATPPAPVAAPAPAPVPVERPPVLTSCDPGGCWTSDGVRLNRSGPLLIGPGGPCVSSGAVVQCP